ncbi:MAG: CDP-glycerol--glycerophosphate glycerophosphotransferase [Eggerthellaceae bacterium]|nr:CDP-glycerol--glycerophosphate glycerophosphotransferase [Eggerthellaceae bacterium]
MHDMLLYIDPGTGSMLFTILIGVISAGIYGLRKALVKARFILGGGKQEKSGVEKERIAIFSDSKRYWNVFEPICDELERREVPASYLTASPDDPALNKTYSHVKCAFIGEGNKAFAYLNMLKSNIVLSTTPGLDVYQWKRSRDVSWYAHVFHALGDATMYRMFGLDYYDAVLLAGPCQTEQIRALENLRKLPEKELVTVGLPHLDAMQERLQSAPALPPHPTTVLLAPSWGASAILSRYGGRIIESLLKTGYHVIVRPHPQSFESESDLMERLMKEFPASDTLEWNRDNDNFDVLRRSDIMISDFSGVIYDFALIFDRPVIYTEPAYDKGPYDAWWLDEDLWTFNVLPHIGAQLDMAALDKLKEIIDDCLNNPRFEQGRKQARDEGWAHRGEAAVRIVDYLLSKEAELLAQTSSEKSDAASAPDEDGDEKILHAKHAPSPKGSPDGTD